MNSFSALMRNQVFITSLAAWMTAQILKAIIYAAINKTFDVSRLFGDGGMPSGHSATVVAMACSCGIACGMDSPIFAVAAIVAIVVMHDAMGVRLETGKQAKLLNELVEHMEDNGFSEEEKLKEFVGHTPVQVVCGAILGLAVAIIIDVLFFL